MSFPEKQGLDAIASQVEVLHKAVTALGGKIDRLVAAIEKMTNKLEAPPPKR